MTCIQGWNFEGDELWISIMPMGWVAKGGRYSFSAISRTYSIEDVPVNWNADSSGAVPDSMSCELIVNISTTFFSSCNEAIIQKLRRKVCSQILSLEEELENAFDKLGERESNEKEEVLMIFKSRHLSHHDLIFLGLKGRLQMEMLSL